LSDNIGRLRGEGFVLDKEKIRRFMHCSVEAKLQWLEDANHFLHNILDKKKLALWEQYRSRSE